MVNDYPEIVSLLIEQAKSTFKPKKDVMLDPDWVTNTLFTYQQMPEYSPMSETHQDCVWGAESIKPRSEWNITKEQNEISAKRWKEKWMAERKQKYAQRF